MKNLILIVVGRIVMGVFVAALCQSCLETRESAKEAEEKQAIQRQVGTLQRNNADVNSKFQEAEESVNRQSARIDALENKVSKVEEKNDKGDSAREQKIKELNDKLAVHQEALTKMESEIIALQAQLTQLTESAKKPLAAAAVGSAEASDYKLGQEYFDKKQWQDAAITFEKYRKANPKGKHAADALYKIGVSFQEMGQKDEAKIFYKEVSSVYPNTNEAKKAATRLKGMK